MVDNQLAFIVGMPRSGTTLVQALLTNNEETSTASEPWVLLTLIPLVRPDLMRARFDYGLSSDATNEFLGSHFLTDRTRWIREAAINTYREKLGRASLFIDKTPRYYEILSEIRVLFPESRIIVVKRDPVNVVRSLVKRPRIKKPNDLLWNHRDLLLAPYLIQDFVEKDQNSMVVKYESLLDDPSGIVSKLYDYLGLSFSAKCLDLTGHSDFQGKYGDRNLNREKGYHSVRVSDPSPLERGFNEFISGYLDYLGPEFLDRYGYKYTEVFRPSKEFDLFLDEVKGLDKEWDDSLYNLSGKWTK